MEPESRQRRARRAVWTFRLAFYPAAVALGLFLLFGRGHAAADTRSLAGETSQGMSVSLELDGDGRPVALHTRFKARCPNGFAYTTPWSAVEGGNMRFRRDGSRVWALETATIRYDNGNLGRAVYSLDAWVDGDRAEGLLEVVEHVDGPKGAGWACGSERVAFTAQR